MVQQPSDMTIAAIFLAAATSSAVPPPTVRPGARIVQAQVSATIVEPAIVRQDKGLEVTRKESPRPQQTERNGAIYYEFE